MVRPHTPCWNDGEPGPLQLVPKWSDGGQEPVTGPSMESIETVIYLSMLEHLLWFVNCTEILVELSCFGLYSFGLYN